MCASVLCIRSLRMKAPRPCGVSWRWRRPCGGCWQSSESPPVWCMYGSTCDRSGARLTAERKVIVLGSAFWFVVKQCMYVCRHVVGMGQRGSRPARPRSVRYVLSVPVAHTLLFPAHRHHSNCHWRCKRMYCTHRECMYVCMYVFMYVYVCDSLQRHTLAIDNRGHLFSWWVDGHTINHSCCLYVWMPNFWHVYTCIYVCMYEEKIVSRIDFFIFNFYLE